MTAIQRHLGEQPTLSVLGLGHVGLPTALSLVELGWHVVGADDDLKKAQQIARGETPFYEPDLEELLQKSLNSGQFRIVDDVLEAVKQSQVVFSCVGTPINPDGKVDLSQVESVAKTIAKGMNGYKLIVEKSTTPVYTASHVHRTIQQSVDVGCEFDVAVNPEFLREGTAIQDALNPDRIVLGVESQKAREILVDIYQPLIDRIGGICKLVVTDRNTAELIKHGNNLFLAMKVSFINMMADLCEETAADVTEVAKGLGLDHRIGPQFMRAGIGYGGGCLPKDIKAFIQMGEEHGVSMALPKAVEEINESRVDHLIRNLRNVLWVLRGKTVAVLGLAFKPGTDDIREAPSLKVIARLLDEGAKLQLHDPQAIESMKQIIPEESGRIQYCESAYAAATGAHALLVVTEWEEYRTLDLSRVKAVMQGSIIMDGRNIFDPNEVRQLGFEYYGIGRPH